MKRFNASFASAVNIWKIKGNDSDNYNLINETSVVFTPNIPQNDAEIVAMAKNLYGVVSEQTIFEMLEQDRRPTRKS